MLLGTKDHFSLSSKLVPLQMGGHNHFYTLTNAVFVKILLGIYNDSTWCIQDFIPR